MSLSTDLALTSQARQRLAGRLYAAAPSPRDRRTRRRCAQPVGAMNAACLLDDAFDHDDVDVRALRHVTSRRWQVAVTDHDRGMRRTFCVQAPDRAEAAEEAKAAYRRASHSTGRLDTDIRPV